MQRLIANIAVSTTRDIVTTDPAERELERLCNQSWELWHLLALLTFKLSSVGPQAPQRRRVINLQNRAWRRHQRRQAVRTQAMCKGTSHYDH